MASRSRTSEAASTPKPPSLIKSSSGLQSSKSQQSITGFFQKSTNEAPRAATKLISRKNSSSIPPNSEKSSWSKKLSRGSSQSLTPAPSSDALEELLEEMEAKKDSRVQTNGLPSPITPMSGAISGSPPGSVATVTLNFNSPSRKVGL